MRAAGCLYTLYDYLLMPVCNNVYIAMLFLYKGGDLPFLRLSRPSPDEEDYYSHDRQPGVAWCFDHLVDYKFLSH